MLCDNYRVVYLPVDYHKRSGKSKIVPWDFVGFVTLVLRLSMLFNPLKVLVPAAMVCFLLGGVKLTADIVLAVLHAKQLTIFILATPMISTTSVILMLSGLQILLIGMISDGLVRKIGQRMPAGYRSHSVHVLNATSVGNQGSAEKAEKNVASDNTSGDRNRT